MGLAEQDMGHGGGGEDAGTVDTIHFSVKYSGFRRIGCPINLERHNLFIQPQTDL